jgi:hypothetical protein
MPRAPMAYHTGGWRRTRGFPRFLIKGFGLNTNRKWLGGSLDDVEPGDMADKGLMKRLENPDHSEYGGAVGTGREGVQ